MTYPMWLDNAQSVIFAKEEIPEIIGYRRAHHADLSSVCRMMEAKNYDLFGDVEPGQLFERACLSLVQINAKQEVVSNVILCNFPNVPAVPQQDWLSWIRMHYELPDVVERNTLFVHLLVWDSRYEKHFFKALLEGIFAVTYHCLHVIIVVPPGLPKEDVNILQEHMTRVAPTGEFNNDRVQTLYVSLRHEQYPKLRIRRVVEEDNDNVIPIIDADSKSLRELYGDFYISEMLRYPGEGNRQLIVAESEGLATGVMCLNSVIDVDLLNEIFELGPYNGLRKSPVDESPISGSPSASSVANKTASEDLAPDSIKDREKLRFSLAIAQIVHPESESSSASDSELSSEPEIRSANSLEKQSGISPSVTFASRLRTSVFAEAISELPIKSLTSSAFDDEDDDLDDLDVSQLCEKVNRKPSSQFLHGDVNAFVIELFSMEKNIDEQHGRDYLEAAFECFPDLEYCVILVPSTRPFFPLLENFARVPLRFDKDFPMVLYVAHRATLLGFLQSREADADDREIIEAFLRGIPKKQSVVEDFDAAVNSENTEKACYVFTCEDRLIGLSILCPEPHVDQLRIMYNVEEYISLENTARNAHARLLHFILVPAFSTYHRFFFRELMRLSCTTAVYYRLYDSETTALNRTRPLVTCLDAMVPVKSRTRFNQPWPRGEEKENYMEERCFSLFLMNPRLATMPKRVVNAKVVVVGASDCGVAFAEFLALRGSSSNIVHFTNLTLVSPNGLPFERKSSLEHATMIPFRGRYCYAYRQVVPSRVWINVVHGTVSHINRKDKHVTVFGLGILSYDYLVLTCGLNHHSPRFQRDDKQFERRGSQQAQDMTPLNCFCVNDDEDALVCFERLKELADDLTAKKSIVLYGHNINCYCTLRTLLELGVPGAWIVLIHPKLEYCEKRCDVFFENAEIDEAVASAVRDAGVRVLSGWSLKNWVLEAGENSGNEANQSSVIKSIKIQNRAAKKLIVCDALVYFGDRTIPMKTFMAISKAGLVFDGRLVINPEYRTNDPSIFAAGSFTKYSREFHAEHLQHEYYNSVEIGERFARSFKQTIDSYSCGKDEEISLDLRLPVFHSPIVVYCELPGGFRYLHVRKPGKRMSRAVHVSSGTYGDVLVTGSTSTDSEVGYFRIRFNQYNKIETLTCLSRKAFRVQDLITLYGKHDSMLNNLRIRFQNSLVTDLYAYFTDPWAAALFHDRFDGLRVENRAALLSKVGERDSLIDDAKTAFAKSDWKEMSEDDRRGLESKFQGSLYQSAISSALINFLEAEEELLPGYCNPQKLRRQLTANDDD